MKKLSLWEQVQNKLKTGRTFSQYPTGKYLDSYYRWDDNKEVIPLKTIKALVNRKILTWDSIIIKTEVIKYNPYV